MHDARDDDGGPPSAGLRDRAALRSGAPSSRTQRLREEEPWRPTAWQLLREGRWGTTPGAAAGALVVVAGVVVLLVLSSGAGTGVATPTPGVAVPVRTTAGTASGALPAGGSSTPAAAASTGGGAPSEVVVDVSGQVAVPGLVRLPPGARVDDALRAAGGALPGADLRRVNLARLVADGEQVVVPAPGEELPAAATVSAGAAAPGAPDRAGPVDLNTADAAALDALPDVGPVLAQRVLDWRAEHGRFSSTAELGEVPGIGPTTLARLEPLVTVGPA